MSRKAGRNDAEFVNYVTLSTEIATLVNLNDKSSEV